MRINPDFTLQPVGDTYIAVAVGEKSKSFHGMVKLNETGAFLWKKMAEKDVTVDELVDALLSEYAVDRDIAERDVKNLVALLEQYKVLQ